MQAAIRRAPQRSQSFINRLTMIIPRCQSSLRKCCFEEASLQSCAGGDGNLCVYEVAHSYLPIKYLSTTNQQQAGCMAVSSDSTLLACVSHTDAAAPVSLPTLPQ